MSRRHPNTPEPQWGRGKLVALLSAAICALLLVVLGLAVAVYYTLYPSKPASAAGSTPPAPSDPVDITIALPSVPGSARAREDNLAATPMPVVALADSRPGPVSTRDPGTIVIPNPTSTGPAGVPTGFPHTPEGALAQLAALDQVAMQSASLTGVRAVIVGWAVPGGPTPQSWSAVKAMGEFLDSAGLSGGGSQQLSLIVTPLMGLIKGTVGTDFVIPCVDLEFDATITSTTRVANADCQRMVWQTNRWMIGPGAEPAAAPSIWADTDAAIAVGYRDLRHE